MNNIDATTTTPTLPYIVVKYTPIENDADAEEIVGQADTIDAAKRIAQKHEDGKHWAAVIKRRLVSTESEGPVIWYNYNEETVWP